MAKNDGKLPYTSTDYQSLVDSMIKRISEISNRWTDYGDADVGIVLVKLLAGIGDMLAYYLDKRANEVYPDTAKLRKSLNSMYKLISYRMKRPIGAYLDVTFRTKDGQPAPRYISIPRYTVVSTNGGINFITTTLARLDEGQTSVKVPVVQGDLMVDIFYATGEDEQEYILTGDSVAENLLDVVTGNVEWLEDKKQSFLTETPYMYEVEVDYLNETKLKFNRLFSNVPAYGTQITVTYANTAGAAGNIGAGLITKIVSDFTDADLLTVTNEEAVTNGRGAETIKEAKVQAPRSLRAVYRAVSHEDYESLSRDYPGIAKAKSKDGSIAWRKVVVYVAPDNGGIATQALKDGLKEYLDTRREICTEVEIADAVYVPVEMEVTVEVRPNFRQADVKTRVENVIQEYFKFENQKFGGGLELLNSLDKEVDPDDTGIQLGDLYELIESQTGVRYSNITLLRKQGSPDTGASNLDFADIEIPTLGSLTVTVNGGV